MRDLRVVRLWRLAPIATAEPKTKAAEAATILRNISLSLAAPPRAHAALDAIDRGEVPVSFARSRRASTACVRRSQRRPAKGNESAIAGPTCFAISSFNSARARCSRVFTVSGRMAKSSAVSSMLMPSMSRATRTVRNASGSASMARSRSARISRWAMVVSGSSSGLAPGKRMISALPSFAFANASNSTVGLRRRRRPSASFMTMRASQVPSWESPRNEMEAGEGADIGVLQRIFRFKVVAQDAARDAIKSLVVLLEDQRDCAGILGAGTGHKLRLIGSRLLDGLCWHKAPSVAMQLGCGSPGKVPGCAAAMCATAPRETSVCAARNRTAPAGRSPSRRRCES